MLIMALEWVSFKIEQLEKSAGREAYLSSSFLAIFNQYLNLISFHNLVKRNLVVCLGIKARYFAELVALPLPLIHHSLNLSPQCWYV